MNYVRCIRNETLWMELSWIILNESFLLQFYIENEL